MDSLVTWTKVVYALHAFSLLTGILGAATVVGGLVLLAGIGLLVAIVGHLDRIAGAVAALLRSGKNVVSPLGWFYPSAAEAACRRAPDRLAGSQCRGVGHQAPDAAAGAASADALGR